MFRRTAGWPAEGRSSSSSKGGNATHITCLYSNVVLTSSVFLLSSRFSNTEGSLPKMRRALCLLRLQRRSTSAAANSLKETVATAAVAPSISDRLSQIRSSQHRRVTRREDDQAHTPLDEGLKLLNKPSTLTLLWSTYAAQCTHSQPELVDQFWSGQLSEASRFFFFASQVSGTTEMLRVMEALSWFLANRESIEQHAAPEQLSLFATNIQLLRDGRTNGKKFVCEHVCPILRGMLRHAQSALVEGECPKRARAFMTARSLVAPFVMLRQLSDDANAAVSSSSRASNGNADSSSNSSSSSSDPQRASLVEWCSMYRVTTVHILPILKDACALLQAAKVNRGAVKVNNFSLYEWNAVLQLLDRLCWLSGPMLNEANGVSASERAVLVDIAGSVTIEDIRCVYRSVRGLLNETLEKPLADMETAGGGAAQYALSAESPGLLAHMLANASRITVFGVDEALGAVHGVVHLVPEALRKAQQRDVVQLLAALARCRSGKLVGQSLDLGVLERITERCRGPLFRSSKTLRTSDAVHLLQNFSKLRCTVPLDVVVMLCDVFLAGHNKGESNSFFAVTVVTSLHRLCQQAFKGPPSSAADEKHARWSAFQSQRALDVMHTVLPTVSDAVKDLPLSEVLVVMEAYCGMNNSTSMAMYKVVASRLDAVISEAKRSGESLPLRSINGITSALSVLQQVTTSTFEEEALLVKAAEQRRELLEASDSLATAGASGAADVAWFLSSVVDSVAESVRAGSHQSNVAAQSGDPHPISAGSEVSEAPDVTCDDTDVAPGTSTTALQQRRLRTVLDSVPRFFAAGQCSSGALGSFAKSIQKINRWKLLPASDVMPAVNALLHTFVEGFSTVVTDSESEAVHRVQDAMRAPHNGAAALVTSDALAVLQLFLFVHKTQDAPFACNNSAYWNVMLHRIALVLPFSSSRDTRVIAHLLASSSHVWGDGQLAAPACQAVGALLERTLSLAHQLTISEVAALVASLNSLRDAAMCSASHSAMNTVEEEEDDEVDDAPVVELSSPVPSALFDSVLDEKWMRVMHALGQRVGAQMRDVLTSASPHSPSDIKYLVRVLKGFADGDANRKHVASLFYNSLPFFTAHATRMGAVELSLVLNAYASVGVWNAQSMEPLISAVHDGIVRSPLRQLIALLQTIVRSGFVRKELSLTTDVLQSHTFLPRDSSPMQRGSASESMGRLLQAICQRLHALVSDNTSTVKASDAALVLDALAWLNRPPQPLFDMMAQVVQTVVCRGGCGVEEAAGGAVGNEQRVRYSVALLQHVGKYRTPHMVPSDVVRKVMESLCRDCNVELILPNTTAAQHASQTLLALAGGALVSPVSTPADRVALYDASSSVLCRQLPHFNPSGFAHACLALQTVHRVLNDSALDHSVALQDALRRMFDVGTPLESISPNSPMWGESTKAALGRVTLPLLGDSIREHGRIHQPQWSTFCFGGARCRAARHADRVTNSLSLLLLMLWDAGFNNSHATQQECVAVFQSSVAHAPLDVLSWCISAMAHWDVPQVSASPNAAQLFVWADRAMAESLHLDDRGMHGLVSLASLLLDANTVAYLKQRDSAVLKRGLSMLNKLQRRSDATGSLSYALWVKERMLQIVEHR